MGRLEDVVLYGEDSNHPLVIREIEKTFFGESDLTIMTGPPEGLPNGVFLVARGSCGVGEEVAG